MSERLLAEIEALLRELSRLDTVLFEVYLSRGRWRVVARHSGFARLLGVLEGLRGVRVVDEFFEAFCEALGRGRVAESGRTIVVKVSVDEIIPLLEYLYNALESEYTE